MNEPPQKKEKPNQSDMTCINIDWLKKHPSQVDWKSSLKLNELHNYPKTWTYRQVSMAKEFLVLFGMVKTPTKSWSMKQYHGSNILPQVVKEKLPLLAFSNYDSKVNETRTQP